MDNIARGDILDNIKRLDEWENAPSEPASGYDDMSMRELKLLVTQLTRMLQDEQRRSEAKDAESARLLELLSNAERDKAALREDVSGLQNRIQSLIDTHEADRTEMSRLRSCIEGLQKRLDDAVNQAKSDRGARFGSQSQKGAGRKKGKDNGDNPGTSAGGARHAATGQRTQELQFFRQS